MRVSKLKLLPILLMLLALLVAACGGGETASPTPTEEPSAQVEPTEEAVAEPTEEMIEPTEEAVAEPTQEVAMAPEVEPTEEMTAEPMTIVEIAAANSDFSTLVAAVTAADLVEALSGEGPFTVFAPTNEAFAQALEDLNISASDLLANKDLLTAVLTYHVVSGVVMAEDVMGMDGQEVETLNGATLKISVTDDGVVLNDTVNVVATDIVASNGVIHVIDAVLLPPIEAQEEPMAEPTEEATEEAMEQPAETGPQTILEIASADPNFNVLQAAVTSAGLTEALSGEGPFTVFAPTNDAFDAALDALGMRPRQLFNDKELLTSILTYHVVSGAVKAEDVMGMDGQEVVTLNGASIKITVSDGKVFLNDTIEVVMTDIEASNGIIHVISGVLVPPMGEEAAMEEPMAEATEAPMMEEPMTEMMGPSVMLAPGEEVKIGVSVALSGEGLAPFGIDIRRGVELALEDRPTVTVGGVEFPVVLDVQDDLCSPEGGQTVANRFASDEDIVAVIGPMCSSGAEAAIPIFDEAGYTSISPSATAANLTQGNTSFNRTVPSDAAQGVVAAEFIYNTLGFTKIAVIDDGSTYGEGLARLMAERFVELGGEVVASDAVTVGDTDFRALLESIAAAEPQLIYFGGFNAEAARLIEQRADVGLENVPFMGADGIFGPELIELTGSASEGVIASRPIPTSSEELDAFRQRYIDTYGEEPPSAFNTNAYDAANIILNAIEAVGVIDDRGDLVIDRAALAAYVRSAELDGLTGELRCVGNGECATSDVGFFIVKDGEYVPYESAN